MERKGTEKRKQIELISAFPLWEECRREAKAVKASFPVPPFRERTVHCEGLQSFYRAVLSLAKNIIFLGSNEIILFAQNLAREYILSPYKDRSFYFCSYSDISLLERLTEVLPPEDTTGVILPRRVEEFKLLTLSFSLPWKRVFLGSPHGIVAQAARELFLPFCPLEEGYHYFWHRGTLLYLPLITLGGRVDELERGFASGYPLLEEDAVAMSLLVRKGIEKGWRRVCFLVDTQFFFSFFQSFLPLLERSCQGEATVEFTVEDWFSFWDVHRDLPSWEEKLASTLFVIIRGEEQRQRLFFQYPSSLKKIFDFEEWDLLHRLPFGRFHEAEYLAFLSLFRERCASFLEISYRIAGIEMVGQMVAFLHQWACYNAWLRGLDLLSDPPVSHLEVLMKSFLKKGRRVEARK